MYSQKGRYEKGSCQQNVHDKGQAVQNGEIIVRLGMGGSQLEAVKLLMRCFMKAEL